MMQERLGRPTIETPVFVASYYVFALCAGRPSFEKRAQWSGQWRRAGGKVNGVDPEQSEVKGLPSKSKESAL